MLWKATATAEKEMQNMKHVWKRYLIVTAMTVVLGLSAGCGSAAEDTNNNQNNTQDENTLDGNENKNNTDGSQVPAGDNNGTSPDTNTDMNNDGTNGTNNNMNGATSGKGTVDENGNRLDENGNIIEDLGEDVGEGPTECTVDRRNRKNMDNCCFTTVCPVRAKTECPSFLHLCS